MACLAVRSLGEDSQGLVSAVVDRYSMGRLDMTNHTVPFHDKFENTTVVFHIVAGEAGKDLTGYPVG